MHNQSISLALEWIAVHGICSLGQENGHLHLKIAAGSVEDRTNYGFPLISCQVMVLDQEDAYAIDLLGPKVE